MLTTTTNPTTTYASRLHAAYLKLTFKSDAADPQDARREGLFQRLVLHHLLLSMMYTLFDWRILEDQQTCTYDFLQAYAKQLWPGQFQLRLHLAEPAVGSRATRSFVGAIDGHWSSRRNGGGVKKKLKLKMGDGGKEGGVEEEQGFDVHSTVGNMALSRVGKAFAKYVEVLLEPGLSGAEVEDTKKLIEGIVSCEMGGAILVPVPAPGPIVGDDEVKVKVEDESSD